MQGTFMMFKRVRRVLGVGVMATAAILALASPASAPDHHMYTDDGNPGGRVDFTAYGDIVKVCDVQADGYDVYVDISPNISSGSPGYALEAAATTRSGTTASRRTGPDVAPDLLTAWAFGDSRKAITRTP
jgi:hypothetical protein